MIKVNDTVIFAYNNDWFDGQVQIIHDTGVDVIYLEGYKSRNDFILYKDIVAKVDKTKPYVELKNAPYKGHFEILN